MLCDGNGDFARRAGMLHDFSSKGLGFRSRRYAMIVDNGLVHYVGCDSLEAAGVDNILARL